MVQNFTLSNGLQVVTYSIPSLRSMHLRMSVKGGSIVETPQNNGLAHFMEHMLVQGIPSFPNVQSLSSYIEGLAGNYNAFTSQLTVSFVITVPFSHTNDAMRIASEVFFEPLFPEDAIEKERRAVLNEIKQDMDSRWYRFQEFFRKNRFQPTSPLNIKTVGTPSVVETLTRDDLYAYWKKYFTPKNTYLFLIGNLPEKETRTMLEQYFGKYSSPTEFSGFPQLDNSHLKNRNVFIRKDKNLQVNYLDITIPAVTMTDSLLLRIKQDIALIILGRLRTSRLFQLLRYERGLVYSVSANDAQWPGTGYIYLSSEVSNEHMDEVFDLMMKELVVFRENGPLEKELAFTKHYLANSWLMSFDNPSSIADWISGEFLWKEKILMPEDYIKLLDEITVKDLVDVMKTHWDMKKMQVSIQGPLKNAKEYQQIFLERIKAL